MSQWAEIVAGEEGATAVEYAVMLGLIIVVCIAVIATIGTTTRDLFDPNGELSGALNSAS